MSTTVGRPSASLHFAVGELKGSVEAIRLELMPRLRDLESGHDKHDQRITDLEIWRGRAIGGGGVILFLVTSWEVVQHVIRR